MRKRKYPHMLLNFTILIVSIFQPLPPYSFWSVTSFFPDLISNFRNRVRLMGSHGLQGGITWLEETDLGICPLCKSGTDDVTQFLCGMINCQLQLSMWIFSWCELAVTDKNN